MSEPFSAILCLGSNTAARQQIIAGALTRLGDICDILASSSVYEAPDDSGLGGPYLNVVLSVVTRLTFDQLRADLKRMECDFGRDERSKSVGCMPLDIDIIIWDGRIADRYQFSREYFQRGYREL